MLETQQIRMEPKIIPPIGRMRVPVKIYYSDKVDLDEEVIAELTKLSELDSAAESIVALPDIHLKPLLESPSSTAVALRDVFSLTLSSPSQNCGMSLLRTSLNINDINSKFLNDLFAELRSNIPVTRNEFRLTPDEFSQVLLKGSSWVVDNYGLDPDILNHIEENGNLYANEDPDPETVLSAVPRSLYDLGRKGFGIIGRGNHFLELQVVEEIIDTAICEEFQLQKDQIVVMFHTGSDAFGALVGRYFARRKRTLGRFQRKFSLQKALFHLHSSESLSDLRERWKYYFSGRVHILIPIDSDEGHRCMFSVKASANYGYANRTAIVAAVKRCFESVLNSKGFHLSILYDLSHNSIFEEEVDGEKHWVHRHNSCRVFPPSKMSKSSVFHSTGQPVLLPGSNRTSSYICVGREGAINSLCSIDHGAGEMIDRFESSERCKILHDGKVTKLYRYDSSNATDIPHLSDEGINEVVDITSSNNIAKPVARLRPIAVLKG